MAVIYPGTFNLTILSVHPEPTTLNLRALLSVLEAGNFFRKKPLKPWQAVPNKSYLLITSEVRDWSAASILVSLSSVGSRVKVYIGALEFHIISQQPGKHPEVPILPEFPD